VVESVGEGVVEVAAGDTVVPVFSAQCGNCPDCLSDRSNICSELPLRRGTMPRDGTSRFSFASTGEPIHHFIYVSSFTEYTVVDVAHVVRIEPGIPHEMACLLSCGVSTGKLLATHSSLTHMQIVANTDGHRSWCGLEGSGGGARVDRRRVRSRRRRVSGNDRTARYAPSL
jgi:Zn-dependent alcohol dehydrogenase